MSPAVETGRAATKLAVPVAGALTIPFARQRPRTPATALATTYEWPGRTGVARLLGDERTRQCEPSQTIPLPAQ